MEKKFKFTALGRQLRTLSAHATSAFLFSLIWLMGVAIWATKTGGYIYTALGLIAYFFTAYNSGVSCAVDDKRSYTALTPHPLKGLLLPITLTLVNIMVIVLYKCTWAFGASGETPSQVWSIITNILCIAWFAPYQPALGMAHGHFEPLGYIIILFLPIVANFLGYFAGYKDFYLKEKLSFLVYEKKKK